MIVTNHFNIKKIWKRFKIFKGKLWSKMINKRIDESKIVIYKEHIINIY
jgi:hypothetical protein